MGVAARGSVLGVLVCLLAGVFAHDATAKTTLAQRVSFKADVAGKRASLPVCGKKRSALATAGQPRLTLRARTALVGSRAKRKRVHSRARPGFVVERCSAGRWVTPRRVSRATKSGTLRYVSKYVARIRSGDFRVRAVAGKAAGRRRAVSKPLYVHVGAGELVDLPVSFAVRNVNDSKVSCDSDGKPYTVRGHLTAPRASLDGSKASRSLTVYDHGLGYGEFFFRFRGVRGYDYAAEMARAGHASLTFDLPGYDSSDKPSDGRRFCYGGEATVIHQMIGGLRSGNYQLTTKDKGVRKSFQRIALAGHSAGGFTVQTEAYSFGDIDALALISFGDTAFGPTAITAAGDTMTRCAGGGQSAKGAPGSTGYAPFGATDQDFQNAHFFNISPAVAQQVTAAHNIDPCGRVGSVLPNAAVDAGNLASVKVPLLTIHGAQDALVMSSVASSQRDFYSGSTDKTDVVLPNTGHAVTLGRTAPAFRAAMADWLQKRGF